VRSLLEVMVEPARSTAARASRTTRSCASSESIREDGADLRTIEREPAMQILRSIEKLKPPQTGFRLRTGDYRAFFDLAADNTIHITGVRNRREAYR